MSPSFAFLVLFTIAAGVVVVSSRNIVHAALALGFCLFGVGGFYLLLDAPFIAGAQVLIYVGAITVLILFALMLDRAEAWSGNRGARWSGNSSPARWRLSSSPRCWSRRCSGRRGRSAASRCATPLEYLTRGLLQTYLFPFEVASVLLLAALVGAIVLAKEERIG